MTRRSERRGFYSGTTTTNAVPQIYLKKELYDKLVGKKLDPSQFVNDAVEKELKGKPQ